MKTSLAVLLQAAEYIERKEREMEHGYASTLRTPDDYSSSSRSSGSSSSRSSGSSISSHTSFSKLHRRNRAPKSKLYNSRTTHNELEKNRRAHLRTCLEKLKEMVPLGPDGSRHTTLGLLTRAKYFIKNLEDKDRKQNSQRDILHREHRYLRRRLELLGTSFEKRRSVSESSEFSVESASSNSESDEVDILGNQSDSDDHSSIQSSGSEGGVVVCTRRLTIGEQSSISPDQPESL